MSDASEGSVEAEVLQRLVQMLHLHPGIRSFAGRAAAAKPSDLLQPARLARDVHSGRFGTRAGGYSMRKIRAHRSPDALAVEPYQAESTMTNGVLCNDAEMAKDENGRWGIHGAPTEGTFVVAAAKAGWDAHQLRSRFRRLDAIPFDSARKYMATLDEGADKDMDVEPGGDRPAALSCPSRRCRSSGSTWLRP